MKKKITCLLLALLTMVLMLPVGVISVSAAPAELEVKWNSGYVGHSTNANFKNQLSGASAGWRYTDIIIVEKAGTRISFSMNGTYPSNAVWVFSTWKQSGDNWVLDLDGANVEGTASYEYIGQTKSSSGGMDYEFITDHDNQAIRICIQYKESTGIPKIYSEPTTAPSTLAQLAALDFTATFNSNGTVDGLRWFCGYASSETNTNGSAREVKLYSSSGSNSYAFSNLIRVPKKGTKISFTISTTSNSQYNAFTRYKLVGSHYEYDAGFNATDSLIVSGTTFSYVTSEDNEVIRLCCRPKVGYTTVYIDPPTTVTWKETNEAGTLTLRTTQKTEWPDPELLSLVTGAPLIGTPVSGLKWNHGYIGSQYHDSAKYTITSPSNIYYYYSDVFTVPKAGTTVMFFDHTFNDFDGGKYASTSVLAVSHWKKSGSNWIFDKSREYLTGCDVYNIELTSKYRSYAYTTTEDNENLRLCLRYAPIYASEQALIPDVYLIESTDFAALTTATDGKLSEQSYTDMSGNKVSYGIYLPKDYGAEKQYTLVFDTSADGAVANSLVSRGYTGMVLTCTDTLDRALRVLDEVCEHYPVKVSDLLFVGDEKLASHAAAFENIRLCQSMLLTSGTAPKVTYTTIKALSSFASANEAADWLVGQTEDHYTLLDGLKLYAIGDSYFGGSQLGQHQTWVNLLGYKYRMTFHNYGIGGNTLASASGIGSNQPPMYTRYNELPNGGDIYIIEGGRNDRHYSVPFGKNTDTRGTTIKGAINIMIKGIRAKNPDALIVLVTPWSHKSETGYIGTNNDYADAIRELAEYYNDPHIVCLYAADTEFTGIDMSDARCRAKYCIAPTDVSHLNADGMYMVEPIFERWIAEKYAALKSLTLENSADAPKFTVISSDTTTAPADTTTAEPSSDLPGDDTTTASSGEKKGCGSIIALGIIGILIPAALVIKKKRSEI
ncbi:MAG: SGNH/GDSL hydrolase family protein [Eubacteriales bacterium]|nr:SGNH/GDSL hydrolase family protein [Eubacteriales bacterium]